MEQKIRDLIKQAMIEKNKNNQITYKSILENAQKIAKKTNDDVTDDMIVTAIKNEIKQLNDLLEYCKDDANRAEEINEKIKACKVVLPKMASEDELMDYLISNSIEKNMGACMKVLKEKFGSNMDNKMASSITKEYVKG